MLVLGIFPHSNERKYTGSKDRNYEKKKGLKEKRKRREEVEKKGGGASSGGAVIILHQVTSQFVIGQSQWCPLIMQTNSVTFWLLSDLDEALNAITDIGREAAANQTAVLGGQCKQPSVPVDALTDYTVECERGRWLCWTLGEFSPEWLAPPPGCASCTFTVPVHSPCSHHIHSGSTRCYFRTSKTRESPLSTESFPCPQNNPVVGHLVNKTKAFL